jgi:LAS superfamily LD-carboxypeptidase LdcB
MPPPENNTQNANLWAQSNSGQSDASQEIPPASGALPQQEQEKLSLINRITEVWTQEVYGKFRGEDVEKPGSKAYEALVKPENAQLRTFLYGQTDGEQAGDNGLLDILGHPGTSQASLTSANFGIEDLKNIEKGLTSLVQFRTQIEQESQTNPEPAPAPTPSNTPLPQNIIDINRSLGIDEARLHAYMTNNPVQLEANATDLEIVSDSQNPNEKVELSEVAALQFRAMTDEAKLAGVNLVPISGFRSYELQRSILDDKINREGMSVEEALKYSAPVGFSEHHTGNAIDIGDASIPSTHCQLSFQNTKAYQWLKENASKFGFILSYEEGNSRGVEFEPWHFMFDPNLANQNPTPQ